MTVRSRQVGRRAVWLGGSRGGLEHTGGVWDGTGDTAPSHHLCFFCSRRPCWCCPWSCWHTMQSAPSHQRGQGQGADLAQHPTWKGHCVAQQWHGWFQEGQVWNHCSAFILCVVFPDKEDVAGKYLCSCMLGDWVLSLHLSPRPLCLPAASESRKAGNSGPWCAQLAYCPLATY